MHESRPVVSLVLRCLPAAADEGFLVGQAEVVDTGEILAVRRVEDLVQIVQRLAADQKGARR